MLEYTLVLERDYSHYIFSIEYTEYSLLLNSVDTHIEMCTLTIIN